MTHSYVRHDSSICATWLIHMCGMTHSYVCPYSFISEVWLIDMCDMTQLYLQHDSFICATWLIHTCDMTHSYVWHVACTCVTCRIRMCNMTRSSSHLTYTHTLKHALTHTHTTLSLTHTHIRTHTHAHTHTHTRTHTHTMHTPCPHTHYSQSLTHTLKRRQLRILISAFSIEKGGKKGEHFLTCPYVIRRDVTSLIMLCHCVTMTSSWVPWQWLDAFSHMTHSNHIGMTHSSHIGTGARAKTILQHESCHTYKWVMSHI